MRRNPIGALVVLMWMLSLLAGCKPNAARSDVFEEVFKPSAGQTLRGINLGMTLDEVRKIEAASPKHDDQWGYVYEYKLGENAHYFLEYIVRDPNERRIDAMVVNVFLEDKAKAADLFLEIEDHMRTHYGVADGSQSHYTWRHEDQNLMVSLRMLDDKKSISLSYGELQPS